MTDTEMNEFCARELEPARPMHCENCNGRGKIMVSSDYSADIFPCEACSATGKTMRSPLDGEDFLTSESANAMLRDEIFANFLQQFERKERPDNLWLRLVHLANLIKGQCPTEQDYKRAIVLAFIEWRKG